MKFNIILHNINGLRSKIPSDEPIIDFMFTIPIAKQNTRQMMRIYKSKLMPTSDHYHGNIETAVIRISKEFSKSHDTK